MFIMPYSEHIDLWESYKKYKLILLNCLWDSDSYLVFEFVVI